MPYSSVFGPHYNLEDSQESASAEKGIDLRLMQLELQRIKDSQEARAADTDTTLPGDLTTAPIAVTASPLGPGQRQVQVSVSNGKAKETFLAVVQDDSVPQSREFSGERRPRVKDTYFRPPTSIISSDEEERKTFQVFTNAHGREIKYAQPENESEDIQDNLLIHHRPTTSASTEELTATSTEYSTTSFGRWGAKDKPEYSLTRKIRSTTSSAEDVATTFQAPERKPFAVTTFAPVTEAEVSATTLRRRPFFVPERRTRAPVSRTLRRRVFTIPFSTTTPWPGPENKTTEQTSTAVPPSQTEQRSASSALIEAIEADVSAPGEEFTELGPSRVADEFFYDDAPPPPPPVVGGSSTTPSPSSNSSESVDPQPLLPLEELTDRTKINSSLHEEFLIDYEDNPPQPKDVGKS